MHLLRELGSWLALLSLPRSCGAFSDHGKLIRALLSDIDVSHLGTTSAPPEFRSLGGG